MVIYDSMCLGAGRSTDGPANGVEIVLSWVLLYRAGAESFRRGWVGGAAVEVQCARAHASFNRS